MAGYSESEHNRSIDVDAVGGVEEALRVEQLSWSIGEQPILRDLTFGIKQGEFVGIVGPNGSGKSSLLRCIYRLNKDFTGDISFSGKRMADFNRRQLAQKLAVVLQEPPAYFDWQVEDFIALGLTPYKSLLSLDSPQDHDKVREAAQQVDVADKLQRKFHSLSGGEKQRAVIARAIVQDPDILLMDEPTNHLDIRHQLELLNLTKTMPITVVVCLHDLNLAASYCDRIILLDKGKMVAEGVPEEVLTEANLESVFGITALIDKNPFNQALRITLRSGVEAYE